MNIDPIVSNYIDITVDKAITKQDKKVRTYLKELNNENKNHMTALKQGFQDDIKKASELVGAFATKTDAREIAREEDKPIKMEMNIIKKEVSLINKKLA